MNIGTFYGLGTDNMYVGMKYVTPDVSDAIVSWGNNPVGTLYSDRLRFIFTANTTFGDGIADQTHGLEVARMIGINVGGSPPVIEPRMGVGNFFTSSIDPQYTLDVNGRAAIRVVDQDDTLTQVLVRDPNNYGLVKWRNASTLGGTVTADNGLHINPTNNVRLGGTLIQHTTVDLNDYNLHFPFGSSNDYTLNNISIGPITPQARVHIYRDYINTDPYPIALKVENWDIVDGGPYVGEANSIFSYIYGENEKNISGKFHAIAATTSVAGEFFAEGVNEAIGVWALAKEAEVANYGVHSVADGMDVTEYNYGGAFYVINNGPNVNYGVYAYTANTGVSDYSGFFDGEVYMTVGYTISDNKVKSNLNRLANSRDIIQQLNGYDYTYLRNQFPGMNLPAGTQYGLVAQEVEAVMPSLVKESISPAKRDSAGNIIHPEESFLALNYNGLIPVLLEAMKDMDDELAAKDAELDTLHNEVANINTRLAQLELMLNQCCGGSGSMKQQDNNGGNPNFQGFHSEIELANPQSIVLDQNKPNPFKERTVITFFVPEDYTDVKIIFFNLDGRVLREMAITERGNGSLQVYASDLSSGAYYYSLVADGRTIDTKQMVKVR